MKEFASSNYVNPEEWVRKLQELADKLNSLDYDAIVAIKRSGLMVGVYLSHILRLPLFTNAEIDFLDVQHQRILVVDTTSWSGRTLRKTIKRVEKSGRVVVSAWVLYQLHNRETNIPQLNSLEFTDKVINFWWYPEYLDKKGRIE